MAVPKTKVSKSVKNTRKAVNFRAHPTAMCECPQCKAVTIPHCVCKSCGYYKGTKFMETKADKKEAKAAAQ